jgi:hypothetical protein
VSQRSAYNILKSSSVINGDNYPETLGTYLIINAPSFFPFIWGMIKGFLDEKTRDKIRVVPAAETQTELLKFIKEEDIPSFVGGKCTCAGTPAQGTIDRCLLSNKGPWADYERTASGVRKIVRDEFEMNWEVAEEFQKDMFRYVGCASVLKKSPSNV